MTKKIKKLTLAIQGLKDAIAFAYTSETLSYRERTEKIQELQELLRSTQTVLHYELILELTELEKAS